MLNPEASVKAALFRLLDHRLRGALAAAFGDEFGRTGPGGGGSQRMLSRHGQEGHAKQRIRPCGENLNLSHISHWGIEREAHPRPLAAANPIGLHQLHPLGPAVERVQALQQIGRVFGDGEEPLDELLLLHRRAGAPAPAIDHLLIGQHGAIDGVPIHPALTLLHQAGLEEVQKQRLLLAVIFRVAGGEFAAPIQAEAHALQLGPHIGDIGIGPLAGMNAPLARRILGRQAKGVPTHGMHDHMPAGAFVARHHIAQRVVAHMPHMDLARGVGEHFQHVVFRHARRRHIGHREDGVAVPCLLPARLGSGEIITGGVGRDLVHDGLR